MPYTTRISPTQMLPRMVPDAIAPRIAHMSPQINAMFARNSVTRLDAARSLGKALKHIETAQPQKMGNHYHSSLSWGIGYPAFLAFISKLNGMAVTGLVDHYTVSGAKEFRTACFEHFGIPATVGYEARSWIRETLNCGDMDLSNQEVNSPGNPGEVYVVFHGFPGTSNSWLGLARAYKTVRFQQAVDKINDLLGIHSLNMPWDMVIGRTGNHEGNILDRHVTDALFDTLYAASDGNIGQVIDKTTDWWGPITAEEEEKIGKAADEYAKYMIVTNMLRDRLLKAGKPAFFMPSEVECPPMHVLSKISEEEGSILVYPVLKKEIPHLEHLIPILKRFGFRALSFMPDRNTDGERKRIMECASAFDVPVFSGMDVNNWTQPWVNDWSSDAELVNGAFALVGHEISTVQNSGLNGIFGQGSENAMPDLYSRMTYFNSLGREWPLTRG